MDAGDAIKLFLARHKATLHWILRDSAGVWLHEDLESEACWSLLELQAETGAILDLHSETDATRMLDHMRRRARKAGGGLHRLLRPDQADNSDDRSAPGWDRLIADQGDHPASLLEALESTLPEPSELPASHSQAAGWAYLLRRFDNEFARLAVFLPISPSWCYACARHARHLAHTQWPLPHPATDDDDAPLRPWRSFKLPPRGRQAAPDQRILDFWHQPTQPATGQLWLL